MDSEKLRTALSCNPNSSPSEEFSSCFGTFLNLGKARWTGPSLTLATPGLLLSFAEGLSQIPEETKKRTPPRRVPVTLWELSHNFLQDQAVSLSAC